MLHSFLFRSMLLFEDTCVKLVDIFENLRLATRKYAGNVFARQ